MAGEYNVNLSNGTLLTIIYPLESNGPGNVSTPRLIIESNTTANTFTLASDVTFRFVPGFAFNVALSAGGFNDAAYVVITAVYDGPNDKTVIAVASVVSQASPLGQITYVAPANTQLLLPGRGVLNWGENIVEDLVHLSENFADVIANIPSVSESLIGQHFWSTDEDSMYTLTSTGWSNSINAGSALFSGRVGINNALPTGSIWLEVTGDIQANSQFLGSNQSAGSPTFSFSGTQNMGMYNNAGLLSFAVSASEVLTLKSSGLISVASAGYEALVTGNNDIPNKKYVDDGITNAAYVATAGDTMTGLLTLSGDPTSGLEAATKQYVDTVGAGLDPKASVHVATIGVLTGVGIAYAPAGGTGGTGIFTNVDVTNIDGHICTPGERILVKDQADPKQNGIYVVVTNGALGSIERSTDMDGTPANEVSPGNYTFVGFGTANSGTSWMILGGTATGGGGEIVLNTDDINWSQVGGTGTFTGGTNVSIVGNVISVSPQGAASALDADLWDGQQSNISSPVVNEVLAYDGTDWVNQAQSSATPAYELLTATAAQTVFNTTISTSKFSGSPGNAGIQVFVNGILQLESLTFSVTGANQITFLAGLLVSDQVTIFSFGVVASLGWNLAISTYDGISLGIGAQATDARGVAFKPDGTELYVIDSSSDTVYQYTLATPWDLSTGGYSGNSKSILAEENNASGISLKSDGTKMYIIGQQNDTVYQYTLSTPWDMSTATYDTISFSTAAQDTNPRDIAFKADGTKMYVTGTFSARVYQYTLPTPWLLTGATFDVSIDVFPVAGIGALGITFKPDGTRMFIAGNTSDEVFEYTLPTPWVLTGAVYNNISYDISGQSSLPTGIGFKPDGVKMYIIDTTANAIFQYTL